jgi:hypothetical protein
MSPASRRLLRCGVPAACFAAGLGSLAAGLPAGLAWTLIVVSLGLAVQCVTGIGPASGREGRERRAGAPQPNARERRLRAESRPTRAGPR